MRNKNVHLDLQHCYKMSSKAMLRVVPLMFKPVAQQIRLLSCMNTDL